MRTVLVLAAVLAAVTALPTEIPEPGQLALVLGEEDFEDYLDAWLELEQSKSANASIEAAPAVPQPVYLRGNRYLAANGNSGQIRLNTGEQVVIACTGSGRSIRHPNIAATRDVATATCVSNNLVSGAGWLNGNGAFAGSFFPGVAVNTMYTQANQKTVVTRYVGATLADRYITSHQFMARGHLAAKSDYVFATGQRATFTSSTLLLSGSHSMLNLRARIGAAGYNTVIYTGTFGVTQLRDQNNRFVDIYLVPERNQIPVPLYFYKVVYDSSRRIGTAFVSINNPYYTLAECRARQFCTDRCRNNSAFNWLRWQPDRIDLGYSFCCTVDDFRRTIPHLPSFTTNGLLS
ncbi:hypothetical protein HF086_011718 [Spodoptera exigua]|uniref:DNA/RNA non-specific endonuclease/pyrophosphatase/phosphodiesterase domain-containing protein n=1 Tax=Spodoptera exigua TaxID=7107 RepID=A0A922MSI6_SPOEX|nr:hypothetical protein HF086_011718 [Spodoptera exigua]